MLLPAVSRQGLGRGVFPEGVQRAGQLSGALQRLYVRVPQVVGTMPTCTSHTENFHARDKACYLRTRATPATKLPCYRIYEHAHVPNIHQRRGPHARAIARLVAR